MNRRATFLVASILLLLASTVIVWTFLTTDYPTHSDVFYKGVEFGALAVMLVICLSLICYSLYRSILFYKS